MCVPVEEIDRLASARVLFLRVAEAGGYLCSRNLRPAHVSDKVIGARYENGPGEVAPTPLLYTTSLLVCGNMKYMQRKQFILEKNILEHNIRA